MKKWSANQKFFVILGILALFLILPYAGGYVYFKYFYDHTEQVTQSVISTGSNLQELGKGLDPVYNSPYPQNFFDFPATTDSTTFIQKMRKGEGDFNLPIFSGLFIFFLVVAGGYLFPKFYGFKKVSIPRNPKPKVSLPIWFWIGLVVFLIPLCVLLSHTAGFPFIRHWAVIPLFWGFAVLMDGFVYKRTGGKSLMAQHPRMLLGIGLASIPGWMIFEYLNFFIADNWYYPYGNLISKGRFVFYALMGSSGLMAMAFEWYDFLRSFDTLWYRYLKGPKFTLPEWFLNTVLVLSFLSLILAPFAPLQLFFTLWVSPLLILLIVLAKLGIWTPATPIRQSGNWSYILLFALAFYLQGIIHEGINYLSGWDHASGWVKSYNPDYWVYCVPYINIWHVFEMPFLGLMGYLPFGIYCAVWWITFAYLFNIPTQFEQEQKDLDQE